MHNTLTDIYTICPSVSGIYTYTCGCICQAQYIYVYQALIEFNEEAVIPCSQLRQTFDKMCRNRQLAQQFEVCVTYLVILRAISLVCIQIEVCVNCKGSYIAQYPIFSIAQSALHFSLFFNGTPNPAIPRNVSRHIWETSSHGAINSRMLTDKKTNIQYCL